VINGWDQARKVEADSLPVLMSFLGHQSEGGRFVLINKGRLARDLQLSHGDAFLNVRDHGLIAVEFKSELVHTGNLFIETWSNRSRFKRGWLDHLDTDMLLYYFRDREVLYSIPFQALKHWAFRVEHPKYPGVYGRLAGFREVCQQKHEQLNDTWGRLVPVYIIRKEVGCKEWHQKDSGEWQVTEHFAEEAAETTQQLLFS
jgi:hypothetical protein